MEDVPDEGEANKRSQLRRPFGAVIGLAAVILLAVIGFTTIRHIGPAGISGATAPGSPASPSAGASPGGAFDPTLEGPGVSPTEDASPAILVVLACAVLGILAVTARGRRRLVPAMVAVVLAG